MANIPELSMHRAGRYTQAAAATELQKLWGVPLKDIELVVLMRLFRSVALSRRRGRRPNAALSTTALEEVFTGLPHRSRFL